MLPTEHRADPRFETSFAKMRQEPEPSRWQAVLFGVLIGITLVLLTIPVHDKALPQAALDAVQTERTY